MKWPELIKDVVLFIRLQSGPRFMKWVGLGRAWICSWIDFPSSVCLAWEGKGKKVY
jgi:hypothetical protein